MIQTDDEFADTTECWLHYAQSHKHIRCQCAHVCIANKTISSSGGSRNFVQGVPIPLWKNFGSFRFISGRFGKYWPKFKIWPAWSLCLKKKIFLKPKQICILYTKKPQKEKKMKRKEMNKGTWTINYKFIWNINKIINYYCLVVS